MNNNGDNVKRIGGSDHADVEHVDVTEHVNETGRIEGVDHVNGIEHDEDGMHSDEAEQERVGGEDDAGRIVHIEHLVGVENAEHMEIEIHDSRGKCVDHSRGIEDNRRYLSRPEVADSGDSYHRRVQNLDGNINHCEYQTEHVPHRSMDLDPRENVRQYRQPNRL